MICFRGKITPIAHEEAIERHKNKEAHSSGHHSSEGNHMDTEMNKNKGENSSTDDSQE